VVVSEERDSGEMALCLYFALLAISISKLEILDLYCLFYVGVVCPMARLLHIRLPSQIISCVAP